MGLIREEYSKTKLVLWEGGVLFLGMLIKGMLDLSEYNDLVR